MILREMTAAAIGSLGAGSALGRYELLLPIAQGGMATVWAARMKGSRGFAKIVAIKTMLPALSSEPRFEQMFLSEAEIASRIKHPNVCEILDLGEQDGVLYLVMDWIDGASLVTLLGECQRKDVRLPYALTARIGADAARGLHAAHELKDDAGELFGVVHRDVSPHNILVTLDGRVKIVDFGVAKAVARSDHQVTTTGQLKGKAQYMAPEQAFCDEVDRRTDVFSLGVVLYQLTTGTNPFRADNELATLARITSPAPVPAPASLVADVPPALSAVVMKALAKDRDQRFGSMSELARELEAVATQFAAPETPSLDMFMREVLRERTEVDRAALKDALRAADDHPPTSQGARLSDNQPASSSGVILLEAPAALPARAGRGQRIALAAGLIGLGAVLGATGLVWFTRATTAPASEAAQAPASLSRETPAPMPSALSSVALGPPSAAPEAAAAPKTNTPAKAAPKASVASAPAAPIRAVRQSLASPSGASSSAPLERPLEQNSRTPIQGDPRAKLRDPGF